MTQLVLATTLYGAATVAAAIEAGALPQSDRRVLVAANTTATPEFARRVDELDGFEAIRGHFHQVHSYGEAIAPAHPAAWMPHSDDVPLLERYLRAHWDLGPDPIEVVVESIQVPPARALATVFATSRLTVYADGLMTYGPTRTNIGAAVGDRVRAVVHPDLIPGLRPVLLREYDTPSTAFDVAALRKVLDRMLDHVQLESHPYRDEHPPALVVGQFLSALGVIGAAAEQRLHERMVAAAVVAGASTVWFKPHPSAPRAHTEGLVDWARGRGLDTVEVAASAPAEAILAATPPRFVVGCFSTALVTAARLYGIPAATVGIDELLQALRPYENSNRVPATIVGELFPDLEVAPTAPSLPPLDPEVTAVRAQPLVDTVAYCMQPTLLACQRDASTAWLTEHVDGPARRYFTRKRLTALGLPGAAPLPFLRHTIGPARRWVRRRGVRGRKLALRLGRIAASRLS